MTETVPAATSDRTHGPVPGTSDRFKVLRLLARGLTAWPLMPLLALYLLGTGRWGSYLSPPGMVVYIGDIGIALAASQVVIALLSRRTSLRRFWDAPLLVLTTAALFAYAVARFAGQADISLVALRDLAPYGYAAVAIVTLMLPVRPHVAWRLAVYTVLVFHLVWVVVTPRLSGYPWQLPILGTDAQVFSSRPDFDAAVLGIGAALAAHEILVRGRSMSRVVALALLAFAAASVLGLLTLSTRAGLLAGMLAIMFALVGGIRLQRFGRLWSAHRPAVLAATSACLLLSVLAIALSPAGARLTESFSGGAASGTISARQTVWGQITDYVLADPERTAVGVGFGRDFIVESGSAAALEGGVYQNVRSPHMYVLGTSARLGVAGGILASLIILLGWWAAFRTLRGAPDTLTSLAAFVVVAIPVVALLGVVLESPFGAIPYFWAIGQIAASALSRRPNPGAGNPHPTLSRYQS